MASLDKALANYHTADGGPAVREHIGSLVNMDLYSQPEEVKGRVGRLVRDIQAEVMGISAEGFDPNSLTELAYDKFRIIGSGATSYFELGVYILQEAHEVFGVSIDQQRVLEGAYATITNEGDRGLKVVEDELGIVVNPERVMEEAYQKAGQSGFALRAMDALCYAHEHEGRIDPGKLDQSVIEADMVRAISAGSEKRRREELERITRHLRVLKEYDVHLTAA